MTFEQWVIIAGLVVPVIGYVFTTYRDNLKKFADRERYLSILENPRLEEIYITKLGSGLEILDRFFGKKLLSVQALVVCWLLSMVYGISLFFFSWFFGNNGELGGVMTFAPDLERWRKIVMLLAVVFTGLVFFDVFSGRLEERVKRLFQKLGINFPHRFLEIVAVVVGVAGAVVVGMAGAGVGVVGVAWAVGVAGAGAVGRGVAGAGVGAVGVVGAVVVAGAVAIILIFIGEINSSVLILIFSWLLLPLLNSPLDWLSWGFSRFLGRGIQKSRGWRVLGTHIILDLGVALILLCAIAALMAMGLEGLNNVLAWRAGEAAPFNFAPTLMDLKINPFGEHIWITLMLLTTLVPTLLHGLMVLLAMVTWAVRKNWLREYALTKLKSYHKVPEEKDAALQDLTPAALYFSTMWLLAILTFGAIGWIIWTNFYPTITQGAQLVWEAGRWGYEIAGGSLAGG